MVTHVVCMMRSKQYSVFNNAGPRVSFERACVDHSELNLSMCVSKTQTKEEQTMDLRTDTAVRGFVASHCCNKEENNMAGHSC